jgi:hypothetical protein
MADSREKEARMNSERSNATPPEWAESVLRWMLPSKDRESVSGDLLEEYRESIVPALGDRARCWYVRQVAVYVWQRAWVWGMLVAAIFVVRFLLDAFVPIRYVPHVIAIRSSVMSWMLVGTFALAAGWQTWRTGHIRSGLFLALVIAWIGALLTAVGTGVSVAIWHDAATMSAIEGSGGLDEALWGMPMLLTPIGLIAGMQGAIVARLVAAIYGWSRSNTKSA